MDTSIIANHPAGDCVVALTGILIVCLKDPHVPGERSARSCEPQYSSAGIHPGKIRATTFSGSSTQRRSFRRQKTCLLLDKGN